MTNASHSALQTSGQASEQIANLFYWMLGGAIVIYLVVIGLAIYAIYSKRQHPERLTRVFVLGGGAVMPTVVLTVLMSFGLSAMPELHRRDMDSRVKIRVSGVRWWWRVEYLNGDGKLLATMANEVILPVDQNVQFELLSEDVIHSFWIPSLGGKMDMIPGRINHLKLHPTQVGTYGGVCAEYCGEAHTQMRFFVEVVAPEQFEIWLEHQSQPYSDSADEPTHLGWTVFMERGCAACHAIRGTTAAGEIGPDLTHFATRRTIGAGVMPHRRESLANWIVDTHRIKPGVEMPPFERLRETAEFEHLLDFMETLR